MSPAGHRRVNSTLGELGDDRLEVTLHPRDADLRGLKAGEPVRVFNRLGEVVCALRVSERIRPGVASLPKGSWRRASPSRLGARVEGEGVAGAG